MAAAMLHGVLVLVAAAGTHHLVGRRGKNTSVSSWSQQAHGPS